MSEKNEETTTSAESQIKTPEISATAVARMMGVATTSDIRILEGKMDLISTRVNAIGAKIDRVHTLFQQMPTGSDLERIDVHIGSLKTMLRDLFTAIGAPKSEAATQTAASIKSSTEIITADDDSQVAAEEK